MAKGNSKNKDYLRKEEETSKKKGRDDCGKYPFRRMLRNTKENRFSSRRCNDKFFRTPSREAAGIGASELTQATCLLVTLTNFMQLSALWIEDRKSQKEGVQSLFYFHKGLSATGLKCAMRQWRRWFYWQ